VTNSRGVTLPILFVSECALNMRMYGDYTDTSCMPRDSHQLMEKGRFMHATKVGLLGLAFKGGSDDERDSPSLKILELLLGENVVVTSHDPHIKGTASLKQATGNADAIIIATNHPEFKGIEKTIFNLRKKNTDCIILDCWGILDKKLLCKYGFDYIKLGSKKK
jgi:UDP-N-acetyl-D-mannosaminuronate dehydrogenase